MGRKLEDFFFLNQGFCFELFVFVFIITSYSFCPVLNLCKTYLLQNSVVVLFTILLLFCYRNVYISLCSSVSTVSLAVVELHVGEKC